MRTDKQVVEILNDIEEESVTLTKTDDKKSIEQVVDSILGHQEQKDAVKQHIAEFDALNAEICKTNQVPYYIPIGKSRVPLLGGFLKICRRVTRRYLEYIFRPMINAQTANNNATVQALNKAHEVEQELLARLEQDREKLNVYEHSLAYLREQLCEMNEAVGALEKEKEKDKGEIANLSTQIANLEGGREETERILTSLNRKMTELRTKSNAIAPATVQGDMPALPAITEPEEKDIYSALDYSKFELHFRGSRAMVKERQMVYAKYFKGCNNVLDLGCGRGEFLEDMRELKIPAHGVDLYAEYVEYCDNNGLNAVCGDAVAYLKELPDESLDGLFCSQVVEHISTDQLIALCRLACLKLKPGSLAIIETPNPESLVSMTQYFYVDPSHQKPIHPKTLKYFMEEAGFREAEIFYPYTQEQIPKLESTGNGNVQLFNERMEVVSDLVFKSADYAVIARK